MKQENQTVKLYLVIAQIKNDQICKGWLERQIFSYDSIHWKCPPYRKDFQLFTEQL